MISPYTFWCRINEKCFWAGKSIHSFSFCVGWCKSDGEEEDIPLYFIDPWPLPRKNLSWLWYPFLLGIFLLFTLTHAGYLIVTAFPNSHITLFVYKLLTPWSLYTWPLSSSYISYTFIQSIYLPFSSSSFHLSILSRPHHMSLDVNTPPKWTNIAMLITLRTVTIWDQARGGQVALQEFERGTRGAARHPFFNSPLRAMSLR